MVIRVFTELVCSADGSVRVSLTATDTQQPYALAHVRAEQGDWFSNCGAVKVRVQLSAASLVLSPAAQRSMSRCVSGDCDHWGGKNECLRMACRSGNVEGADYLIRTGADVNFNQLQFGTWRVTIENYRPPIMEAAAGGHVACVAMLLRHGASVGLSWPTRGHSQGDWYYHNEGPAVWLASSHGFTAVLDLLLRHNADPNTYNRDGESCLLMASAGGHLECARLLLAAGADANYENVHQAGSTPSGFSYPVLDGTPLMIACSGVMQGPYVKKSRRCSVDRRDYQVRFGETVQSRLVQLLLEHAAEPNCRFGERYDGKETPLAAAIGSPGAVRALLSHGAAIRFPRDWTARDEAMNSYDSIGMSPLTLDQALCVQSIDLILDASDEPWSTRHHMRFPPAVRAAIYEHLHVGYELQKARILWPARDIWLLIVMPNLELGNLRVTYDRQWCDKESEGRAALLTERERKRRQGWGPDGP